MRGFLAELGSHLSASVQLCAVSLRRLLRSRQTMISLLLLCFAALAVVAWSLRGGRSASEFLEAVFLTVHVAFLLPVFCLCYATAGIATDREEGTLVYLLATPMPRPLIFAAKGAASLLLSLAWTMGSLVLLCQLGGKPGRDAIHVLWAGIFWSTLAYVALFLLFSVVFRRATIVAMAYALFLETFVGNIPGIAKRAAISFHARCLIFDSAAEFGVGASGPYTPSLFLPISGASAQSVLIWLTGLLLLASVVIFTNREYAK